MKQKSSTQASCTCEIYNSKDWTSLSLSPTPYVKAKPIYNLKKQLINVQSNYSLANTDNGVHDKMRSCHYSTPHPWANCFGARCHVTWDNTATCLCSVHRNKNFIIGPGTSRKCDAGKLHIWSGILSSRSTNNTQLIHALYQKFYPRAFKD